MYKVAIVEDEKNIRNLIRMALNEEGFDVEVYPDGESAWNVFQKTMPDVIILDIMMPRMNGIELCRRIRTINSPVSIIFLSSRDDEYDKILGLESGADDYVCKPFSMLELIARIKASVRRFNGRGADCAGSYDLVRGSLKMCTAELITVWKDQPVKLSVTEYRILSSLAESPGTVKTREQLMTSAFPEDAYVNERAADSHIKRVRKKIKEVDPDAEILEAVYGLGYRLRIDE